MSYNGKGVKISEILDYLDAQQEHLILQAINAMYEDGSRGIFCTKFIPYSDLLLLGYKGFRQFLISMYEIDDRFIMDNKGELENLKSEIKKLKGEIQNEY